MIRRGALVGAALLVSGCVYYNAIYNAERAFDEAESLRAAGLDSLASARYADVIGKARRGFEEEPTGPWAAEALYLMGRAHLRRGELEAAADALTRAARLTDSEELLAGTEVYLAAVAVDSNRPDQALPRLNPALRGPAVGRELAEGHLWRARALLRGGRPDEAWWDLDRSMEADPGLRVPASLERLLWGIRYDQHGRAAEGVAGLLDEPGAARLRDSLEVLLDSARIRWGPKRTVALLRAAGPIRWSPGERGRLLLRRASYAREAGDTSAARVDVETVARGVGPSAVAARATLAHWRLAEARDLVEVERLIPWLLPTESDEPVASLLTRLREVLAYADMGLESPLGWFAAAEVARDALDAPFLARGLFLAYADAAPGEPWSAKALLAALAISGDDGDRAWLQTRLEDRADSPYVRAARGQSAPGFEALEETLAARLQEMKGR